MSPLNEAEGRVEAESLAVEAGARPRQLSPEAQRALQEAAERRALLERQAGTQGSQAELGGRAGPDPVRYGDWENGGIASDF